MSTIAGPQAERRPLPASPRPSVDARAVRRARARRWDRVMSSLLWALALALVGLLAYFILYTIAKGVGVLNWDFVTKSNIAHDFDGPEVFNTFYILILALLLCVPVALGGAIYLVVYAKQGPVVTILRFATETLAGVPSIILGLFGFLVFVTGLGVLPGLGGNVHGFGYSRLAGALTLVILNLPLLLRVSEDALLRVPGELREASEALGASRVQTVFRVMLPTGLTAITTGIILTAGKMIGETAALIYTTGSNSPVTGWFSLDPFASGDTLTVHLFTLQSEGVARNAVQLENGTACLLIILLLTFNIGLRYLAGLLNRRLSGRR
jgi:phosphate transport system permease protein